MKQIDAEIATMFVAYIHAQGSVPYDHFDNVEPFIYEYIKSMLKSGWIAIVGDKMVATKIGISYTRDKRYNKDINTKKKLSGVCHEVFAMLEGKDTFLLEAIYKAQERYRLS